jgi:hypothetical protein
MVFVFQWFKDKPGFKYVVYLMLLSIPQNVKAGSDSMIMDWAGCTVSYSRERS